MPVNSYSNVQVPPITCTSGYATAALGGAGNGDRRGYSTAPPLQSAGVAYIHNTIFSFQPVSAGLGTEVATLKVMLPAVWVLISIQS